MDPTKKTENVNTPAGSRLRNDSESSGTAEDGSDRSKRFCAPPQFMIPGLTSASPPKYVTLEEIMQAANGMRDMALVHQIVVDQNFMLAPAELPDDSLHKRVKETMHQAFWDLLREQLAEDPPSYRQALVLLENIKKGLYSLLLPQHTKIRQQINDILDSVLIRQQAENNALNFPHYAHYIISIMGKLCAPVRDDKIKELSQISDVVETFKGILETLDLMALDMANFTIEIAKPDIIAHSIEYERKKFAEFLSIQPDGLEQTRKWLLRHIPGDIDASKQDRPMLVRTTAATALSHAYVEFLEWDDANEYPETMKIDEQRLRNLKESVKKMVIVGTVILVTGSGVGPHLHGVKSFKETIKQHVTILLQSVNIESDLTDALQNISEQVVKDVKESLAQLQLPPITVENEKLLRGQLLEIGTPDHRIRELIRVRVKEFLLQIITSPTAAPQQVPSGLNPLQKDLAAVAGQFLRIVSHNRSVFSQYYLDIIEQAIPVTST